MKKMFLCVVFIVGINTIIFSQEKSWFFQQDMWFTAGGTFGNYFLNGTEYDNAYIGSPGVNLSFYTLFGQKNIGIFFNYGILFPAVNNAKKDYDLSVQLDFILLGVGFGYDISEKTKLHFGVGPNLTFFTLSNNENSNVKIMDYISGLGIGGDIGIKFNITKFLCIDIGTTLCWNFAVFNEISREVSSDDGWRHIKTESSGWGHINSVIGIKPYIAIGYHFNTEKTSHD